MIRPFGQNFFVGLVDFGPFFRGLVKLFGDLLERIALADHVSSGSLFLNRCVRFLRLQLGRLVLGSVAVVSTGGERASAEGEATGCGSGGGT